MTIPTPLIQILVVGLILIIILSNEKLRFLCISLIVIALAISVGRYLV